VVGDNVVKPEPANVDEDFWLGKLMTRDEILQTIRTLASGTLSGLFETANYKLIDASHAMWIGWVDKQPIDRTWRSWQECWESYRRNS